MLKLLNYIYGPVYFGFFQAALPLILAGASGVSGLLGNRKKTSTSTQESSQSSTPNFDPNALNFRDSIIDQYMNQLQNPLDMSGFEFGGIENINKTRELQARQTKENLASRGIRGPALDFALNDVNNQRFSDIIGLKQQTPLLRHQMQNEILRNAGSFFSTIPYGQSSTSKSTATGTDPGNMGAGGLGNLTSTLAYFLGQGAFKKPAAPHPALGI